MIKGMARQKAPIVFKSGEPVSVVCVASTFTSVTYADNGGKVRLSSAGVHGLTTSPAVGASVYVSWSGGTGVNGLYKVLSVDSTTAFTVDLTYVVDLGTPSVAYATSPVIQIPVFTAMIPPLSANGFIRTGAYITHVAATYGRAFYLYLNNSMVSYIATASSNYKAFYFDTITKNLNSKSLQITPIVPFVGNGSPDDFSTSEVDTSVETTLKMAIGINNANTIMTLQYAVAEVYI